MENNGITIPAGTRISKPERRSSRTFMRSGSVSIRTRRYGMKIFRTISVSNINPSTKHTTRLQEDTNLPLLYSV